MDFFQFINKKSPFDHMSAHKKVISIKKKVPFHHMRAYEKVPTFDFFHSLTDKKVQANDRTRIKKSTHWTFSLIVRQNSPL